MYKNRQRAVISPPLQSLADMKGGCLHLFRYLPADKILKPVAIIAATTLAYLPDLLAATFPILII